MELDKLCTFPDLWVGNLASWSLTRLSGDERHNYLQGQFTAEVTGLAKGAQTLSGHCDPTGKLWSIVRLINAGDWLWLLQPQSTADVELPELKKYSVFSKVTIESEADYQLIAVVGKQAKAFIEQRFGNTIASQGGLLDEGYCLSYANQPMRYLLIVPNNKANSLIDQAIGSDQNALLQLWQGLDIIAGYPSLSAATAGQFIPQALNLHQLDAISFTKGCYTGQEIVARAKYRGTNKRAALRFVGQSSAAIESGQDLEMQLGDNWRRCGTIINSFRQPDGYTEILAVVRADSDTQNHYRLHGQSDSQLTLAHLPYSLETQ
ncbi:tRNA-modifying protein YgfZ [Celerinatantimonas yamalensis]|uniref:tRNA-modifying protein YgfZ n=1 Tax=Celerinatantimonas yamalensis TaxID=559956 RepID=A0ABW9G7T3_9GAMM